MPLKSLSPLIAGLLCACAHRTDPSLAITHVSIIDVRTGTTTPDQNVLIRGRHIARITAGTAPLPKHDRELDGRGKFLIPGLWDMHVHVGASDLPVFLTFGITGVRDMAGDLEELVAWRHGNGPRLVFAGPLLRGPRSDTDSGSSSGWVIRTAEQGTRAVDSLASRGVNFIKVHEGLSRDAYFAIAREARARHLAFVGHVPAALNPIEASDAGQKSIEHLEFIPDSCLGIFRGETPPGCDSTHLDSLVARLAANGTWLDPTIGSFRTFAPQQFPAILAGFAQLVPLLRRRHIRVLAGTDLGTPGIVAGASLHDELALLIEAGFTPLEALQAATVNPADFLGLTDSLGTIASGRLADLVLLNADPLRDIRGTRSIVAVVRAGFVLLPEPR